MPDCPYKRIRLYQDPYTKDLRTTSYPCGCCASCLKRQQNEWRMRLSETLYRQSGFIYETLTISDDNMFWEDCRDLMEDSSIDKKSRKILEHYDYIVPFFPKQLVTSWLKRGRELWNYHHREDIAAGKCKRLELRYFGALEYGPRWSRPHLHFILIGVTPGDYVKYFQKTWESMYGYTCTKFIHKDGKSVRNTVKYVSKYVNKGSFESPLVKCACQARPYRVISHGIGREYLDSRRLDFLRTSECRKLAVTWESSDSDIPENLLDLYNSEKNLKFSEKDINKLLKYYDENGYCYNLPRYYRDTLTKGHHHTYLSAAVSRCVYEASRLNRNQEISRFAAGLGITPRYQPESPCFSTWLYSRDGAMVFEQYSAYKKDQALLARKRCAVELKNHYKRPLRANYINPLIS